MPIQLPKPSGAAFGSGGRTRAERLPDASGVPQARPVSDPGVPETRVPNDLFGQGGFEALAAAGVDVANTGLRIKSREEGLARDRAATEFAGKLSELSIQAQESGADFADENVVTSIADQAAQQKDEILASHQGGDFSREMLSNQLDRSLLRFTDDLGAKRIIASRQQIDQSVNRHINEITADAISDPSVPLPDRFGQLETVIEDLGLSGKEADSVRFAGREKITSTLLSRIIGQGQIDENGLAIDARTMLENPLIRDSLTPATRLGFLNRITTIENTVRQAGLKVRNQAAAAEAVANNLGLHGEAAQNFIIATMTGSNLKQSVKSQNMQQLVDAGQIDPVIAQKILAGVLKVVGTYDQFGTLTGSMLIDLGKQGTGRIKTIEGTATTEGPGAQPALPAPGETQPQTQSSPADAQGAPVLDSGAPQAALPQPAAAADAQGAPAAADAAPAQPDTLFAMATGETAITGVGPAVLEALQGIFGQVGAKISSDEQRRIRGRFDLAQIELAQALVQNGRFPVKEVEFIREKAKIAPSVVTDRLTLVSNLVALDEVLKPRQEKAERDSRDTSLPLDTRAAQATNARVISNFRETLGIPDGITSEDIKKIKQPTKGGIKDVVKDVKDFVSGISSEAGQLIPDVGEPASFPTVDEINAMSVEEVDSLDKKFPRDTVLTAEQIQAIKKKLGKTGKQAKP